MDCKTCTCKYKYKECGEFYAKYNFVGETDFFLKENRTKKNRTEYLRSLHIT